MNCPVCRIDGITGAFILQAGTIGIIGAFLLHKPLCAADDLIVQLIHKALFCCC